MNRHRQHIMLGAVSETSIILAILLRRYAAGQSDALCTLGCSSPTCSSMCLLSALSQLDLINATTATTAAVAQSAPRAAAAFAKETRNGHNRNPETSSHLPCLLDLLAAFCFTFCVSCGPAGRLCSCTHKQASRHPALRSQVAYQGVAIHFASRIFILRLVR